MYIRLLIISILLLPTKVFAQQSHFSGKIVGDRQEPVAFATVVLEGTSFAVMSDDKGRFEFRNVPFGTYQLKITSLEIHTSSFKVQISKSEHKQDFSVKMRTENELSEVKVQGKTEKRQMETAGFTVSIIQTKEASLRSVTTNELLDRTVGVRVRQNGGMGSRVEYNLNGMSGSAVGIFLDGIEISTYGSSFNLNNIPPAMIERIEVYKGVLPAHLTGDYVGGAINVVLKKDAS